MPRTASVAALLRVVEEQSATIRALTGLLGKDHVTDAGKMIAPNVGTSSEAPTPVTLPSPVYETILGVADGDAALEDYLQSLALDLLSSDTSPEQVAQIIAQGEQ